MGILRFGRLTSNDTFMISAEQIADLPRGICQALSTQQQYQGLNPLYRRRGNGKKM